MSNEFKDWMDKTRDADGKANVGIQIVARSTAPLIDNLDWLRKNPQSARQIGFHLKKMHGKTALCAYCKQPVTKLTRVGGYHSPGAFAMMMNLLTGDKSSMISMICEPCVVSHTTDELIHRLAADLFESYSMPTEH